MQPDYSRLEEEYRLQKSGAVPCSNPLCQNWAFPENEIDIGVGIMTVPSLTLCQQCIENGVGFLDSLDNTLPF